MRTSVYGGQQAMRTHLSLNALKIRSTSSSRWKADASRLRSFSSSVSDIDCSMGVVDEEGGVL
jgi:hypothetical protein